jgi:hypothetical protein
MVAYKLLAHEEIVENRGFCGLVEQAARQSGRGKNRGED